MPQQKSFLFISTLAHIPWGGCEDLWYKTASLALDKGHKVFVLVFQHDELPVHLAILAKKGAKIFGLVRPGEKKSITGKVKDKLTPGWQNKKVVEVLSKELQASKDYVVVVSQAGGFDFCYSYLDEVAQWLLQIMAPIHVVVQNVPDLGFTVSLKMIEKQKKIFDRAKTVGFVSKRNHISSERILAASITNAYTINNPLNVDSMDKPLPFPKMHSKVSFATVAALRCSHKGQDVLFQTLAQDVWKTRDWELNLYGAGADEDYQQRLAKFYHIDQRIHFHGHVTDIREVWNHNHIHILPSLGEGTPLALIESMYCGRPAITTDVGGNAEYCEHLVNGFIADYPTPNALARVMEVAWEQKDLWEEMGIAAFNSIVAKYDLKGEESLYGIINEKN